MFDVVVGPEALQDANAFCSVRCASCAMSSLLWSAVSRQSWKCCVALSFTLEL